MPDPIYISGIGTASPPYRYTKSACLDAFLQSDWYARLGPRAHFIARTVLQRDNGMATRHLVVASLEQVFTIDPDTLASRFLAHAPALATTAARHALAQSGVAAADIGALVVSTCTGYLCPGLSRHVVERLGLAPGVGAFDLVGQGCAAAVPNLQLGSALLQSGQHRHVLSICVEISSAAMYLDDDPGVLISACLFGDGAGAAVLSATPPVSGRRIAWVDTESFIDPAARDALMFEQRNGMLRNVLTRAVPALAARHARAVLARVLERHHLHLPDIAAWIMHAGGRDVLTELARTFELAPECFGYSAAMLREHGNLSSAFVYFVLQAAMRDGADDGWWWLSSFGAGFCCHGALLAVSS